MQQLIKANEMASYGANSDSINFSEMMNMMCVNNYKSSKKMGKAYIRELLNKNQIFDIKRGIKSIKSFLSIKDSLRKLRFEWIFGVGQVAAKKNVHMKTIDIGVSCVPSITNEAYQFKSGIVKQQSDALLSDMYKAQKTRAEFTVYAMQAVIELCIEDEEIAEFIYNSEPPTF